MALYFITDTPNKLLTAFKKAIDDGHVVTWSYDKDGDFTHTTQQWSGLAWLRPAAEVGRLVMNIIPPKSSKISTEVYAIYHGRFIESMLAHCDNLFTVGQATAMAQSGDSLGG
jgi:hypothetical protein